jgi:hypothetical protein
MSLQTILRANAHNIALFVGNGVNLYSLPSTSIRPAPNSWKGILEEIGRARLGPGTRIPDGLHLTEFSDLLDLAGGSRSRLQEEFCRMMTTWSAEDQHRRIVMWAISTDAPILTTNFERTLADAGGCRMRRTTSESFTDYYPWRSYFGLRDLANPLDGFGIWHPHGTTTYLRSIRLSLSDYMGCVQQARSMLYRGGNMRLFAGGPVDDWAGALTWLNIVFHRPLVIFGLGLSAEEVFLRWLLVERARYFRKFPARALPAWYVYARDRPLAETNRFFFDRIGVQPIEVPDVDAIYGETTWRLT